jgi:hypothetical protein
VQHVTINSDQHFTTGAGIIQYNQAMQSLKRPAGAFPAALTLLSQENSRSPNDLPKGFLAPRGKNTLLITG